MMQYPPSGSWLRTLYGLFAAVAVMTLAACGGGSGAPNNPYTPVPSLLTVTPAAVTAYSGVATTLTVGGGTPPYPGVLVEFGRPAGRPDDDRIDTRAGCREHRRRHHRPDNHSGQRRTERRGHRQRARHSNRSRSPSCHAVPIAYSGIRVDAHDRGRRAAVPGIIVEHHRPAGGADRARNDGRAAGGQRRRRYRGRRHDRGCHRAARHGDGHRARGARCSIRSRSRPAATTAAHRRSARARTERPW